MRSIGSLQDVLVGSNDSLRYRAIGGNGSEITPTSTPTFGAKDSAGVEKIAAATTGVTFSGSLITVSRNPWEAAVLPASWTPYTGTLVIPHTNGPTTREFLFWAVEREFAHQLLASDLTALDPQFANQLGAAVLSACIEEAWDTVRDTLYAKTGLHPAQFLEPERFRLTHEDWTRWLGYKWAAQGKEVDVWGVLAKEHYAKGLLHLEAVLRDCRVDGDSNVSRDRSRKVFFF